MKSGADRDLVARIIERAASRELRLAVAESLTGGLLADAVVSVPGASRVFSGGVVAYDTALKHALLGVDAELLRERGPVDDEVVRQMAEGVRRACATPRGSGPVVPADVGVATTGVAGPDPDAQTGQPAGTVWIAVSSGERTQSRLLSLDGDRSSIRADAVAAAIQLLWERLESERASEPR